MYEEDVGLSSVATRDVSRFAGDDALSAECDHAPAKAARFALRSHERSIEVENKVVPLVHTEGKEDAIPRPDQMGQDRRLRPLTDIDRVISENRRS